MKTGAWSILLVLLLGMAISAIGQDSLNVRRLWQQSQWEDAHGVVVQDTFAYVLSGQGLQVINIANPAAPHATGGSWISYLFRAPNAVAVIDSLVYLAEDYGEIQVINFSNLADPRNHTPHQTIGTINSMAVSGNFLYGVGDHFQIISITNPRNPVTVSSGSLSNGHGVAVGGNYAYVGDMTFLRVINISDPSNPVWQGSYSLWPGHPNDVALDGQYVYVASGTAGLKIFDMSNPESLTVAGSYDTPGNANGVRISGTYAYVTDGTDGLRVIDISNPANPHEVGFYAPSGSANALTISGDHAFVTDSTSGLRIVNIADPTIPTEAGVFHEPGYALNVAINGNHAYLAAGRAGLKIFNISDPSAPVQLGSFPTTGNSYRASIAVTDSYALVPDNSGLRIISVIDPTAPVEVGHDGTSSSRVAVRGNFAYVLGGTTFRIMDISNPAAPMNRGSYILPRSGMGLAVSDSFAYVVAGYMDSLHIIDITNPAAPTEVGSYSVTGQPVDVAIRGHYAFVADFDAGLYAFDVSDPASPEQVGYYNINIPWSLSIRDSFAFVGGGEGGFEIFNISNPSAMVRVGYYNTFGGGSGFAVSQGIAYFANWTDFSIYDCSAAMGLSAAPRLSPYPLSFSLSSFPNPFNATTEIRFDLPHRSDVNLNVFDIEGRLVQTLTSGAYEAGQHTLSWNALPFSSGTYFARITVPGFTSTQKLVLLK